MEMLTKEEKESLNNIITYIKESNDYKKLMYYKDKIKDNKKLLNLIKKVKDLQKEYIRNKDSKVKEELETKVEELNTYNDFTLYNYYLNKVNGSLDLIKNKINNYFDNLFNEELF